MTDQTTCVYCNGPQHLAGAVCSLKPSDPTAKAREICRKMKYDDAYLYVDFIAAALKAERKAGREEGINSLKALVEVMDQNPIKDEAYEWGRQAALEEAVTILNREGWPTPAEIIEDHIQHLKEKRG